MNTPIQLQERSQDAIQPAAGTIMQFEPRTRTPFVVSERYLGESRLHHLKGGFTAEVIQDPGDRLIQAGLFARASEELADVALAAFGKPARERDTYVPQHVIAKNALWVDWLVVVRKRNQPVAFGSATFIAPGLLYLSSAMVVPSEQPSGVGVVANSLLWKLAVETAMMQGMPEPEVVCRTHNRNVASVLLHLLKDGRLSSEAAGDVQAQAVFMKTANHLHCEYDPETGVSQNVYPEGLPAGTKTNDARLNAAFRHVGPCAACYVAGHLNLRYITRLVSRQLVEPKPGLARELERVSQEKLPLLQPLPQVA